MVVLNNKWKLNNLGYIHSSIGSFDEIEKYVQKRGEKFIYEKQQMVDNNIINEDYLSIEKEARKCLLNVFIYYEKILKTDNPGLNNYLLLCEVWNKIIDEVNTAINKIFNLEINGKKLRKKKGESIKHYITRYIVLNYLNNRYGVRDFQEEYPKLKEAFERSLNGNINWRRIVRRADLYVTLNDGQKLWIEVETVLKNREIENKLKRANDMFSEFIDLFDKVVYVFPGNFDNFFIYLMAETILAKARELAEAKKNSHIEDKIEIYFVDLENGMIFELTNCSLVDLEFGDRIVDLVADGMICKLPRKIRTETTHKIKEKVIMPLIKGEFDTEFIHTKKEKLKRLVSFWKKYTIIKPFGTVDEIMKSKDDVKFKNYALKIIKQKFPYLLEE